MAQWAAAASKTGTRPATTGGNDKMTTRITATAVAALMAFSAPAMAESLIMVTGSQGGTWFPLGGAIKGIVEDAMPDYSIQVRPGGGLSNLKAIEAGQAHIAVGNTISTVDARQGREPFTAPVEAACNLGYMYPQYIQAVAVNMDIQTMADLEGRRMAVTPRGATAEQVARQTLGSYGLSYDDLDTVEFAAMTDQVNMMKDGQVDAFFQATSIPAGVVMDVAASRDIRVIPISDAGFEGLREINPGFGRLSIPAGTYPGQDEDVETAGWGTHIIADCGLDEEVVYNITKSIVEGLDALGEAIVPTRSLTPATMAQDVGVPLHPGAERYYRESGAL
jgi:TRAP transporter TAXI family solute receptor